MGQGILPQLRKAPADFGIGLASAPDSSPMAVLEGLAAALELFDSLRDTSEVLASQLWHIAAAPPDSAAKPWWNMTTKLDDASWETLPSEMRKRDISYSAILLRPLPKLPELHAAAAAGAIQSPWFAVRHGHSIYLSGFPASSPKSAKRTGEGNTAVERSPEAKKSRVQPQPNSASPQTGGSPASQRGSSSATRVLSSKQMEDARQIKIMLTQKKAQLTALQQAGDREGVEAVERELRDIMYGLRESYMKSVQSGQGNVQPPRAQPPGDATNAQRGTEVAGMPPSTSAPQIPQTAAPVQFPAPLQIDVPMPDAPAPMHSTPQPTAPQPPPSRTGVAQPPSVAAPQIPQNRPNEPPSSTTQMSSMVEPPVQNGSTQSVHQVWEGTLSWPPVLDLDGRPGQVQVVMQCPQPGHADLLRTLNLPANLILMPSAEKAVPVNVLWDWMHRYTNHCALLHFTAKPPGPDGTSHDENLKRFSRGLVEKSIYAVAGIPGPNGLQEKRILFFSTRTVLAGTFFLMAGGMPDPPKSEVAGYTLTQLNPAVALWLFRLTPQQQQVLTNMPNEKRKAMVQAMIARQAQPGKKTPQQPELEQQQHPQPQPQPPQMSQMSQMSHMSQMQPSTSLQMMPQVQAPALQPQGTEARFAFNPFVGGRPPPLSTALGLTQGPSQPALPSFMPGADPNALMPPGGMMHRRTPSAGSMSGISGVPGVSYEMMQSFMQRNQEGGGGGTGLGP